MGSSVAPEYPHLQSKVQQVFSKNSGGSSRQRQGRRAVTPMALPSGYERLPRKYVCGVVRSIVRNISMKALTQSGRASCRERGEISVGAVSLKKQTGGGAEG